MSSEVMTVPEFDRWIKRLQNSKWAGLNLNRQAGKYLRTRTKKQIGKNETPGGMPWKKTFAPKLASIGQMARTLRDPKTNKPIRIKTKAQKKLEKENREKIGPPLRPLKALNRARRIGTKAVGRGRDSVREIRNFLSSTRAISASRDRLRYGYTPGTRWVEKMANGGTYRKGMVPARAILGMTDNDVNHLLNLAGDAYLKFIDRGGR